MFTKGIFKRALAALSRPGSAAPAEPAPQAQVSFKACTPPEEPAIPVEAPNTVLAEPDAAPSPVASYTITESTAEKLARLPDALNNLSAALTSQGEFQAKLEALLSRMSDPREELIQTLDDLASDSRRQSDLLTEIHRSLAERNESDLRTSSAITRLNDSMDSINSSNAAHVQIMEEMRDRFANAKDETAEEMLRLSRRTANFTLGAVILLLVIAIVEIARVFIK